MCALCCAARHRSGIRTPTAYTVLTPTQHLVVLQHLCCVLSMEGRSVVLTSPSHLMVCLASRSSICSPQTLRHGHQSQFQSSMSLTCMLNTANSLDPSQVLVSPLYLKLRRGSSMWFGGLDLGCCPLLVWVPACILGSCFYSLIFSR